MYEYASHPEYSMCLRSLWNIVASFSIVTVDEHGGTVLHSAKAHFFFRQRENEASREKPKHANAFIHHRGMFTIFRDYHILCRRGPPFNYSCHSTGVDVSMEYARYCISEWKNSLVRMKGFFSFSDALLIACLMFVVCCDVSERIISRIDRFDQDFLSFVSM